MTTVSVIHGYPSSVAAIVIAKADRLKPVVLTFRWKINEIDPVLTKTSIS
jgi:hypothetical protein